jgi:hypothetical protein
LGGIVAGFVYAIEEFRAKLQRSGIRFSQSVAVTAEIFMLIARRRGSQAA